MSVSFSADISNLTSGIGSAKSQISSLSDVAHSTSGGFGGAISGMWDKVTGFVGGLTDAATSMVGFGKSAYDIGMALLAPDAAMEQMQVGFTNLLHSSSAAKDELQKLSDFAAKTPFQMMDLDTAGAKLLAFGETSTNIIPDLTAIGDSLSALGEATPAKLDQIVNIFGKIDSQGHLTYGIMQQFTRDGINSWQALSDATGKPIPVLQEMVKKGLFPASEATKLLRTGMEKMYGGGMAAQAQTFNGLMSTLKDNLESAWRTASGPLFDAAKQGIMQLGSIVGSPAFQNFAKVLGTDIAGAFTTIGRDAQPVIGFIAQMSTSIGSLFSSGKGQSKSPFAGMLDDLKPLQQAFSSGMGSGISQVTVLFKELGGVWNSDVKPGLAALVPAFQSFGSSLKSSVVPAVESISATIGGTFQSHMKTAEGIVASLGSWFKSSLVPAIKEAEPGFQAMASVMVGTVIPGMVKLWAIGQKVVDEVMPPLVSVFEAAVPVMIKISGIIEGGLAASLKFLMPYILQGAAALGQFAGEIATRVAPIAINFFHNLNTAINVFMAVWKAVWPYLAPILKGVWDEIVGVIKVAWAIVSGIVKIGLDLLSGNWGQAWTDVKDMFSGIWDGIKQIIGGGVQIVLGWVNVLTSGVVNLFTGLWNALVGHSIIPDMVNGIISWFGNLVSGAIGWIQSMVTIIRERITVFVFAVIVTVQSWVNNIVKFFGNLGTQAASKISDMISTITGLLNKFVGGAANFGATLIKNFASGITGAIGNVTSAIGNVVGAIGNFLPHSPAKQGELSHLNEYGPSFVKGLSEGITKSKPMLEMAVQATIAPMAKAGSYPASTSAYPSTKSYSSAAQAPVIHNHNHFTVTIDGHEMAGVMVHPLMTEVVHQVRAQKSGGRAA